jgi:hypothetical protein
MSFRRNDRFDPYCQSSLSNSSGQRVRCSRCRRSSRTLASTWMRNGFADACARVAPTTVDGLTTTPPRTDARVTKRRRRSRYTPRFISLFALHGLPVTGESFPMPERNRIRRLGPTIAKTNDPTSVAVIQANNSSPRCLHRLHRAPSQRGSDRAAPASRTGAAARRARRQVLAPR